MHLSHIPQCTIQMNNVSISVLNVGLWDMGQLHCGISEVGPRLYFSIVESLSIWLLIIYEASNACNILHWNENVLTLTALPWLAEPEHDKITTFMNKQYLPNMV